MRKFCPKGRLGGAIISILGRPTARGAIGWFSLAASPTFALMAWASANDATLSVICASAPSMLPINDMAWMYLLMSLFHVSPWLELASGRLRQLTQPTPQFEGH